MGRIFLCHASEDKAQVREVYHQLKALGFTPWLDEVDILPGQDWDYEIELALETSDFVMVFLSTRSVKKVGYVQREFRRALYHAEERPEGSIHTIPVKLDNCVVPRRFSRHQWVNLYKDDKLDNNAFDRIVRALQHGLQQRDQPTPEPLAQEPSSARPEPAQRPSLQVPPTTHLSEARGTTETSLEPTFTNIIGMEFVLIPAGTFMMGSQGSDTEAWPNEKPAHQVTISQPFYLGKYPVTQAQWVMVMGSNPSHFRGSPTQPVECVSWDGVQSFLRMLNELEEGRDYCLPTEAQWEYACRAGTETPQYHHDIDAIAWHKKNSNDQAQPVGQKLPNAWGLYDMLGNMWEWCLDGHRADEADEVVDPRGNPHVGFLSGFLGRAGGIRVFRGGSHIDSSQDIRAAARRQYIYDSHFANLGFRRACLVRQR